MTQKELTLLNLGDSLDNISNIDPRGYGVCHILYPASREYTGGPLCMNAAGKLCDTLKQDDLVYIMTGFVLPPFGSAETDGVISSVLLARSLVIAFGAKPVIVCQEENVPAVKAMAAVVGLHLYESIDELKKYPISMAVVPFTKDKSKAESCADEIISHGKPAAVISIEAPGENKIGKYHNATGLDVTDLEAKMDILFDKLRAMGVLNIAIGDLGNERQVVAHEHHGEAELVLELVQKVDNLLLHGNIERGGCGGGIAVRSITDNIITATVSDWGCYAMIAAIAYLKKDIDIMHTAELEGEAITAAARNGMIDMYGWCIPAIDGFGKSMNMTIVNLMRECVSYALRLEDTCKTWFEKVIDKGFFGE